MSHLLATVNPEAAARFDSDGPPAGTPGTGDIVVFRPRAGERRQGRTEFPAMVMLAHRDGTLDLLVIMDAGDQWTRERVKRATDAEPTNCWVLRDSVREVEPFEPSRLNGMTRDLATLKEQIFGEFAEPPQPVMAYLDDFDKRLKKLEKAAKAKK